MMLVVCFRNKIDLMRVLKCGLVISRTFELSGAIIGREVEKARKSRWNVGCWCYSDYIDG